MKTEHKYFIAGVLGVALIFGVFSLGAKDLGGVVQNTATYSTASSTPYAVGNQVSTKVLDSYSRRAYARICNNTPNDLAGSQDIYVVFGSTAITATTSADQVIENDECYEIEAPHLYIGEVQILTETATTSGGAVYVTELRD